MGLEGPIHRLIGDDLKAVHFAQSFLAKGEALRELHGGISLVRMCGDAWTGCGKCLNRAREKADGSKERRSFLEVESGLKGI